MALHRDEKPQPRFTDGKPLLIAGVSQRYNVNACEGIPAQWQRFAPCIDTIPGRVGVAAYGVCCNSDGAGHFDYIAGVEVAGLDGVPEEFGHVQIPAQRYAVFFHAGQVSAIRNTIQFIWSEWLPQSGQQIADTPLYEFYGGNFDPQTGLGGVEIWMPVKT